jgi:hypothetical protein
MKLSARFSAFLAVVVSVLLAVPVLPAQAQSGTRAGEVARLIPAVSIARGAQKVTAAEKSPVMWEDVVSTAAQARVRVHLDGGAVLNVGADSQLKITKNDTAAQQTEVDLTYGRMRSQVQKLTRPNAKFEVRTPTGVAGVVGTDFFLLFENGIAQLIVFSGIVKWCNLAMACVMVNPGMISFLRGPNQPPDQPRNVLPSETQAANRDTSLDQQQQQQGWTTAQKAVFWSVFAAVIVAAIVVPIKLRGGESSEEPPPQGELRRR